ncbi:MAG: hypothetical protein KDD47_07615, partial [Acidobacteria bacterium]|nr:hypothetical protein [Acidobacteriota bacterium]
DGRWQVVQRSFGPEIYAGTSGIAYFLLRLFRKTGDRVVARTAEGALRHALSAVGDLPPTTRFGFYTGLTGVAFACAEAGKALGDERWTARASELLKGLGEPPEDHILDVLGGTAGAIPALLALARDGESPGEAELRQGCLDLARRLGEGLLASAHRRSRGWSWDTLADDSKLLRDHMLGLSHGTGGIAWALLELFQVDGDERFRQAAEEGFRYERSWYSPVHENWPDLRRYEALGGVAQRELIYPAQWCHGAPGIGLTRLRAFQLLGEETYRREAEAALRTTWKAVSQPAEGVPLNYSLCHGLAGNAELFLLAAEVLGEPRLSSLAVEVGRQGIAAHEGTANPWPSGVQGGVPTPGLMLGTAGTGYFLLRLADPAATPPVVLVTADAGAEGQIRGKLALSRAPAA